MVRYGMSIDELTGYRRAILVAAARPIGQATDAYANCGAALKAARWLINHNLIVVDGDTWRATPAGKALAFEIAARTT